MSASLRFAAGNLRCSLQAGSRTNSPSAQTSARPDPLEALLLGAFTRVFAGTGSDAGPCGSDVSAISFIAARACSAWTRGHKRLQKRCAAWFLGSDHNFAAKRSAAPKGRAEGAGNLCSDPENARSRMSFPFASPCAFGLSLSAPFS